MANICPCTLGNSVAGALFNLKNAKKLNQQDQEEERSAAATVLSRRVDTAYSLTRSDSSWAYLVKFQLDEGQLELKTTEADYSTLREGSRFLIRWKGEQLTAFDEVKTL